MNYTTVGADIAKNVMQLYWVDADTGEIINKAIKRAAFLEHFAGLPSHCLTCRALPVRLTAAILESWITPAIAGISIIKVRKTPSGNPASRNIDSMARALPGTLLACLRTATLPAIRVGAANRNTCQNGKFQGMSASTTPNGLKVTNAFAPSICMF